MARNGISLSCEAEAEPAVTPLLVDARAAGHLCGVSRSLWLRLHASGKVPLPLRLGRRCLWNRAELIAWTSARCPCRLAWEEMKAAK